MKGIKMVQIVKEIKFEEVCGESHHLMWETIIYKIFETNFSFYVKWCNTEKVQFRFFQSFLLVLPKFHFGTGTGHEAIILWHSPDISFSISWGNSNIPCLLLIITPRSLVAKGKFGKISKSQNIMKMILEDSVTNYYYYHFLLLFIN